VIRKPHAEARRENKAFPSASVFSCPPWLSRWLGCQGTHTKAQRGREVLSGLVVECAGHHTSEFRLLGDFVSLCLRVRPHSRRKGDSHEGTKAQRGREVLSGLVVECAGHHTSEFRLLGDFVSLCLRVRPHSRRKGDSHKGTKAQRRREVLSGLVVECAGHHTSEFRLLSDFVSLCLRVRPHSRRKGDSHDGTKAQRGREVLWGLVVKCAGHHTSEFRLLSDFVTLCLPMNRTQPATPQRRKVHRERRRFRSLFSPLRLFPPLRCLIRRLRGTL
jgi:hypothetical protein